jgi:hypothetical protein
MNHIHAIVVALSLWAAAVGPGSAYAADITWPPGIITLQDGAQCSFVFGATWAYQGMRADYDCGDGRWLTSGMWQESDGTVRANALRSVPGSAQGTFLGPVVVQSTSCQAVSHIPNAESQVVCP